jgi:hypothetical protein
MYFEYSAARLVYVSRNSDASQVRQAFFLRLVVNCETIGRRREGEIFMFQRHATLQSRYEGVDRWSRRNGYRPGQSKRRTSLQSS